MRINSLWNQQLANWLLAAVVVCGCLLRGVIYLQNRGLYLDEANLALNVGERQGWGFFTNLDHDQYAPPLFLLWTKLNTTLFSYSEYALRLLPLVGGCATLLLLALAARLLLQRLAMPPLTYGILILLLLLTVLSPILLRYATEFKQYSTDVLATVAVVYAALRYMPAQRQQWLWWWVAGLVLPWFSMPAVFALAGAGCYFLATSYAQRRKKWTGLVLLYTSWLLSFAGYYFLILRHDVGRGDLQAYHTAYFLVFPPDSWAALRTDANLLSAPLRGLLGHTVVAYVVGIVSIVAAGWWLIRRQSALLWLLVLPVVLTYAAASLGLYSLIPRMQLFLYPFFFLLILLGASELAKRGPQWTKVLLIVVLLILVPAQSGFTYLYAPLTNEEMRPLLTRIKAENLPPDHFYINYGAAPAVRYYQTYHPGREAWPHFPSERFLSWSDDVVQQIDGQTLPQYILYGHVSNAAEFAQVDQDRARLHTHGYRTTLVRGTGVAWIKIER